MIDFPPAHAFYGEISNSFHPEQDENVLLYISVKKLTIIDQLQMTASGNLPVDFCRQFLPLFTCLSEIVKVRDAKANLEKGVFIAREISLLCRFTSTYRLRRHDVEKRVAFYA